MTETITIEQLIPAPAERVFAALTTSEDLTHWHNAGAGWSTPYAEVDPQIGGKIKIAYADPEGTVVFDLVGQITAVDSPEKFAYVIPANFMGDEPERAVEYELLPEAGGTMIRLEFDIERMNSQELQRAGWTAHINNLLHLLSE